MKLRNCFKWKTLKDVQILEKNLGNMFGDGRQSIREHLADGRAAMASWQVDFNTEIHTKSSYGKVQFSSFSAAALASGTFIVSLMEMGLCTKL